MNKEGTRSLIARAVKQHKRRFTSRGTRCPSEGPGQSLRHAALKRKESFPWRAKVEDRLDILNRIIRCNLLFYCARMDYIFPLVLIHNYIVSLHRVGIGFLDSHSMIELCV